MRCKDENKLPSYIDAANFSRALTDILVQEAKPTKVVYNDIGEPEIQSPQIDQSNIFSYFQEGIESLNTGEFKSLLKSLTIESSSIREAQASIESWYQSYQDRVAGWYKKRLKKPLFYTAIAVVIFINADLFRITKVLWQNESIRNSINEMAIEIARKDDFLAEQSGLSLGDKKKFAEDYILQLQNKNLPLGWITTLPQNSEKLGFLGTISTLIKLNWEKYFCNLNVAVETIFGWIFMAFALHLGAQFWFESLVKIVNIRGTGVKPSTNSSQ